MTRHFIATLVLGVMAVQAIAQVPNQLIVDGPLSVGAPRSCQSFAGTIQRFGPFFGQSNDISPDTIFLCRGDTLFIDHRGDYSLVGDPDPGTTGGVGYAFYTCPPRVSGPTINDIAGDPCLADNPPPTRFLYQYNGGRRDGDVPFFNTGQLQTFFNNGNPLQLWFAPFTFDDLNGVDAVFEGNPAGPCVNVNTEEAFSVVYLNEIVISDIDNTGANTGCRGSFMVEGGLPQWSSSAAYRVSITLEGNSDVRGIITNGSLTHGGMIEFYVPRAGTYRIEVEDGKSCGAVATVDMSGCESVTMQFPLRNALPGESICLPLTVQNFVDVASMQFAMQWDPSVLRFESVTGINSNLPDLDTSAFHLDTPGRLILTWLDFAFNGITLADGATLFELCFTVVGQIGDRTPVTITKPPQADLDLEIGNPQQQNYGVIIRPGQVNVTPDPLFVNVETDSILCPSASTMDGAITWTVAEGTPPYRITWNTVPPTGPNQGPLQINNSGGSTTLSNLRAGLYQFTVTDASNPVREVRDTVEVFAGPELGVAIRDTMPSCFGEADGSVLAIITSDGVPQSNPGNDFTFRWNVTSENTPRLTGLTFGFYAVTVTDRNGCSAEASVTLSQPPPLTVTQQNTFIQVASCSGAQDGAITITASGGTTASGNYFYQWSNGLGDQVGRTITVMDLNPGEYCVTVTDDSGCSFEKCFVVGAVKTLSVTAAVTDVTCNGADNGEIFATGVTTFNTQNPPPPDLPYTFQWSNTGATPVNTPTTSQLTQLQAGDYVLTLSDATGCSITDTFTIVEPEPLVVSVIDKINETCVVGNDGSIIAGVTGGVSPFTFDWSHDANLQDSIATGLSAGMYMLTVTDASGCTDSLSVDILAPTPPQIVALEDDFVSCPEDTDGELTVNAVAGGAAIVGYIWSNGATTPTITGLAVGEYTVTIRAEDGCQITDTAQVMSPGAIVLDSVSLRRPDCPGFSNGQIALFVSGGTPPYSFTWSTNPGTPTTQNPLPALAAGTYTVTITDANNCTPLVETIVLPDPPTITATFSNIIDVSCPDDATCDGEATIDAEYSDGTTGTFTFTWATGEITDAASATITDLCRGQQSVTVSDGVCGEVFTVEIGSPEEITVDVQIDRVSCNGDADGAITLVPQGGTAPYTYFWPDNGETTATVNDLTAGTYTAIITDARGCTREQISQVEEPAALMLTVDPNETTAFVSCNGTADGVISVLVNTDDDINPLGPTPYTWSGGVAPATSATATDLSPGQYFVTVTDVEGCQDSLSWTIQEPGPIFFTIDEIVEPNCFGDPTFVSIDTAYGGVATSFTDFTFSIDNSGLNFPVGQPATIFAGSHTITVEDPNGCTASDSVFIAQPDPIIVTLPDEVIVELGDSTVQLMPTVTPAGGIYTYQWTPLGDLSSDTVRSPLVFPMGNQEYTLVVTNENGCMASADVFVALDANRNVFIPNVFSPNRDGRNDEFRVYTCKGVSAIVSARLFDRWGGLVYDAGTGNLQPSCEDGVELWDGMFRGKEMPDGVYVYMIEILFLDNVKLTYRGDVTLLR